MRVTIWSMRRVRRWLVGVGCFIMGGLFLICPQAMQTGVRRGLSICGDLLVPSLFPFLCLSGLLIRSGAAASLGRRFSPLMRRLFGFSGSAAVAMILSLIGGYPAGANAVAELCEQGDLARAEAKRLMRCAVSAGPAFVVGGVGVGMLGSVKAGMLLLLAHWLSFAVVALCERETGEVRNSCGTVTTSFGTAMVESVHAATQSLLSMCGFVLLASSLSSLADALGGSHWTVWGRCLFACLTEVSGGCVEASGMGALAPFWIGAALGFGGLSVHGQIAARTASFSLLDSGFFRARMLHALLGGCLSWLFFWWWQPTAVPSIAALSAFSSQNTVAGLSGLIAMMCLCVVFLYTLPQKT